MKSRVPLAALVSVVVGALLLALFGRWAATDLSPKPLSAEGARFVRVEQDRVRDLSTDLEWTSSDNRSETHWHAAERYCGQLASAGTNGWRLPSIDELSGLHDAEARSRCANTTCQLSAPIELTSPYIWSGSPAKGGRRFYFDFRFGTRLSPLLRPDLTRRVLCVRAAMSPA